MTSRRLLLAVVLLLGGSVLAQDPAAPASQALDDKALSSPGSDPPQSPGPTDPNPLDSNYPTNAMPSFVPMAPGQPRDLSLLREATRQKTEKVFSQSELGFDGKRIAAMESVRITLEYSPQILLQDAEVQNREGEVRVAQGEFDTHVNARAQVDARRWKRDEFETGLRQKLRNGVVVEPKIGFRPVSDQDYYNSSNSTNEGYASFDVLIPLAKGGGRLVNEAPEVAARFDLLASILQLRFLASQSVRTTIQAYWNCRAAEERYKLLVESENISMRLVRLTASLVEADELAPAQLPQILADRNSTAALRIRAEAELIQARQRLAIAMGFSPESLIMAPLTADKFPEPPKTPVYPDLNELWFTALNLRDDLRAARQLEKSRKVLMDAAYLELRPRIDLQLRASYLPFETRNTSITSEGGELGGFAAIGVDWPIQNNTAIGLYIQNTAAYDGSRINAEDIKRAVVSGVISAMAEVRAADAEVRRYAEAARFNAEALQAQEDLFRLGQANLTDTITTRQRLIQSQIDYVNAGERYAISLVQLRFESGLLFFSDNAGDWIDAKAWQRVPFVK